MSSKILQKIHEDEQVRQSFQQILLYLMQHSVPAVVCNIGNDGSALEPNMEVEALVFDQQLLALTNLTRAIDVQDNDTKIGHWCTRSNESKVKGMSDWSVYWLNLKTLSMHDEEKVSITMDLTLWAVGKDDNNIQQAIKVWVETHFHEWEIESLQCVRR